MQITQHIYQIYLFSQSACFLIGDKCSLHKVDEAPTHFNHGARNVGTSFCQSQVGYVYGRREALVMSHSSILLCS
jgi:hypothetical protein